MHILLESGLISGLKWICAREIAMLACMESYNWLMTYCLVECVRRQIMLLNAFNTDSCLLLKATFQFKKEFVMQCKDFGN